MAKPATLIINRKAVFANGAIIQLKIWRLPAASKERPHGLKYSLFYGRPGERIVGYDNETGKGDHRHYRNSEEFYNFKSLTQLIINFESDVRQEIKNERS